MKPWTRTIPRIVWQWLTCTLVHLHCHQRGLVLVKTLRKWWPRKSWSSRSWSPDTWLRRTPTGPTQVACSPRLEEKEKSSAQVQQLQKMTWLESFSHSKFESPGLEMHESAQRTFSGPLCGAVKPFWYFLSLNQQSIYSTLQINCERNQHAPRKGISNCRVDQLTHLIHTRTPYLDVLS